jgi:lipoprotein-anchoring transpeptidase ErfK/SrfK
MLKKSILALSVWVFTLPAQALSLDKEFELSPLTPLKPALSYEQSPSIEKMPTQELVLPFVALSDRQVLTDLQGTWISLLSSSSKNNSLSLNLILNGKQAYQSTLYSQTGLSLPSIPLKPGKNELEISLQTSEQKTMTQKFNLYNLGAAPGPTFALVDKYNFTLYYVQDHILQRIYPIATGRPRTPTPLGTFIMGRKEVMSYANTGWGVRRLLIYTKEGYGRGHWSGYAVHGTNNPASIGTEASHGCVRMFNQDVTELSQMMPLETPVVIREQLPFFLEKL